MTTQEIADKLVDYCRKGQFEEAYGLFSQDASSYEMPGLPNAESHGMEAILKKSEGWSEQVAKIHEMRVSDPVVADGYFAVNMFIDVEKKDGSREPGDEICLYKVVDGKITEERFFYKM